METVNVSLFGQDPKFKGCFDSKKRLGDEGTCVDLR